MHYPGVVVDLETGELISDAEVAETEFTAFGSTKHPVSARLVVRRVGTDPVEVERALLAGELLCPCCEAT